MTHLTSPRNERVRQVTALHRSKGRRSAGLFLVEGQHPVDEAVRDGWVREVFCLPDLEDQWLDRVDRVTTVDERVLHVLSDAATPQGVVAVAEIRRARLDEVMSQDFVVVLDGAADPGNVGTIIRTADAVAAAGVVLTSGSVDPFAPKVARSTAGSITHVPVVTDVSFDDVAAAARQAGHRLVGLAGEGSVPHTRAGLYDGKVTIVMGSEADGLSPESRAHLDALVGIPVYGRAESLNLAVATAVTLYEATRQRNVVPGD